MHTGRRSGARGSTQAVCADRLRGVLQRFLRIRDRLDANRRDAELADPLGDRAPRFARALEQERERGLRELLLVEIQVGARIVEIQQRLLFRTRHLMLPFISGHSGPLAGRNRWIGSPP